MKVDESLMGYVLRLSNMNGLHSIYWIYKLLGRDRLQRFKREDVSTISKVFGESTQMLDKAMPRRRFVDGQFFYGIHGHAFSKPYFIRPAHPQLCPLCLTEKNYASSLWDIAFYSACTQHSCLLLDQCPRCSKHIQWNRPLLLTCNCGFPWHGYAPKKLSDNDPILLFSALVQQQFIPHNTRQIPNDWYVQSLSGLSIDTLCKLIWLFGIKTEATDTITTGISKKILLTPTAAGCCLRGYLRLKDALCDRENILREIHLPALQRLSEEVSTPPDISFVQQVLFCLGLSRDFLKIKNHYFSKQLRLF